MPSQITKEKATPVLEQPKPAPQSKDDRQIAALTNDGVTIDAAVRELLVRDHCFGNLIMWSYVYPRRADRNLKAEITVAANQMPIKGIGRKTTSIFDQVGVFWDLHSKYRATTCENVRNFYTDLLNVVDELHTTYGVEDRLISQLLINKMARYSGDMGEEDSNEERFAPIYRGIYDNHDSSLTEVINSFLDQNGNIPRNPEMNNRVNVERNLNYHFAGNGLLALCVRVVANVIAREEKTENGLNNLIAWDFERAEKEGTSIFFLAMPCSVIFENSTEPSADLFGDVKLRQLQKAVDSSAHAELTTLFTYSNVGASLQERMAAQEERMQGVDKVGGAYAQVTGPVVGEKWPPWSYSGGWPRDCTIEDSNYAKCLAIIDSVTIQRKKKRKRDEANIPTEPVEEPRNYKALKAILNDPVVPAPKEVVEIEAEPDDEGPPEQEDFGVYIFLGAIAVFGTVFYAMKR